jgi:lipid-A-disaccharide synthase
MMAPKVMLVAAEPSGDLLGAGLARALKTRLPGVELVGVGGVKMAAEGIKSPFDIGQLSVLGIFEGVAAYPRVVARVKDTLALAKVEQPDVAVLIDSWGFTLRVAQALKRWNPKLKVVKFVGPQVWASRPGRAKTLAGTVDHLLSILPFDQPYYSPFGFPVTFVGNPTMSRDFDDADAGRARKSLGAKPEDLILLILPGSRPGEIKRMMEPFGDAARRLRAAYPDLIIAVPVAGTVAGAVKEQAALWPQPIHIIEDEAGKYDAMKAATVALACSGTVSTELALCGAPMVIAYKLGEATYQVLQRLIKTPYATLFNIAAKQPIAPEFIQRDCTGPKLAAAVAARLDDVGLRVLQVEAQNAALALMGRGQADPYVKAAEVVAGLAGAQP